MKTTTTLSLAFLLISPSLAASQEQDIAITVCEAALKARLKAPSSYRQIYATIIGNSVILEYDAVNSFNAPLRDKKVCEFNQENDGRFFLAPADTKPLTEKFKSLKARADAARSEYERAAIKAEFEAAQFEMIEIMGAIVLEARAANGINGYPISSKDTSLAHR